MLIPMKELNSKKADIEGIRTSIYFLDDSILAKRFNRLYGRAKTDIIAKYECAKNFNIKNLSTPIDALETEKGFCGYIEYILPGTKEKKITTFADYYNNNTSNMTLDEITKYILKVSDIVAECHKNGIIIPDLASSGNVLFNQETKNVSIIDYQDMQIGDITTDAISTFIIQDPIINIKKYQERGLYSPNIDLYTLAMRYFYYATKIDIPKNRQHNINFETLLEHTNISKTNFADCIRVLFDPNKDNLDIRQSIIELNQNYTLSEFEKGKPRIFIKK